MRHPALILLAEDNRILRRAAEVTLHRHGYAVVVAVDGEDALAKARAHTPDLILLDAVMPKLDGFDVLTQLKDDPATRNIPVVMLSNLSEEGHIQTAVARGARAYLLKSNMTPEELAQQVAETLAGSQTDLR